VPYVQFFEEYGFVVIRDVLTESECEATVDEMWTYIETRAFLGRKPKTDTSSVNAAILQGLFGGICAHIHDIHLCMLAAMSPINTMIHTCTNTHTHI